MMTFTGPGGRGIRVATVSLAAIGLAMTAGRAWSFGTQTQVPTTIEDFFQPGTQPADMIDPLLPSGNCFSCHGGYPDDGNPDQIMQPYDAWVTSMMGQAARDPVWHAALAIANADAAGSGEFCIRCHAPVAWLGGRSAPGDTSNFVVEDFDGVTCHHCHRMVDPIEEIPPNPIEDQLILDDLDMMGLLPQQTGNARYIVDPIDTRRGPLDDVPLNLHGGEILVSPYHLESLFCGTCHDVSNPAYSLQKDGTLVLNALDTEHPTQDPQDMVPEQRTYSEWAQSLFATTGVVFPDDRFGGDHPTGVIRTCQDCHMPTYAAGICGFWQSPPFFLRTDPKQHSFNGANTWVLAAIRTFDEDGDMDPDYPDFETGLSALSVADAQQRTIDMLRNASDMQVTQLGDMLKVRVINVTGHKLPTGYPEGRRAWLNVQFLDDAEQLVGEHGAYDFATADLTAGDTKVYEARFGIDGVVASLTGLPAGESFHLALNNVRLYDNRIPPMGFTNASFQMIRAEPVGYAYDDGQHWDDTEFAIPANAVSAVVTFYYQTSTKEYMEFLRDSLSGTNTAGQAVHQAWLDHGMSAPVDMDCTTIELTAIAASDLNADGVVNVVDLLQLLAAWGPCPPPNLCAGDVDCNGEVNVFDLLMLLTQWS